MLDCVHRGAGGPDLGTLPTSCLSVSAMSDTSPRGGGVLAP